VLFLTKFGFIDTHFSGNITKRMSSEILSDSQDLLNELKIESSIAKSIQWV